MGPAELLLLTPLFSALFEWVVGRLADAAVERATPSGIRWKLEAATSRWASELPDHLGLPHHAALGTYATSSNPAAPTLLAILNGGSAPVEDQWFEALLVSVKQVRSGLPFDDLAPFFQADNKSIEPHLRVLATELTRVCNTDPDIARHTQIRLSRGIQASLNKLTERIELLTATKVQVDVRPRYLRVHTGSVSAESSPGRLLEVGATFDGAPLFPMVLREGELEYLDTWLCDAERVRVHMFHGPAGAGKTRLLNEWIVRIREDYPGFASGFVRTQMVDDWRGLEQFSTAVLVFDYAESVRGLVAGLLDEILNGRLTQQRVRVVLLARSDSAWTDLASHNHHLRHLLEEAGTKLPLLPVVATPAHRRRLFDQAIGALERLSRGEGSQQSRGRRSANAIAASAAASFKALERAGLSDALYVLMAALAAHSTSKVWTNAEGLLDNMLAKEAAYWSRSASRPRSPEGDDIEVLRAIRRVAAAVYLVGGVDRAADAHALALACVPPAKDASALADIAFRTLRVIYPCPGGGIREILPDALGERLVLTTLSDEPGLLGAVLAHAPGEWRPQILTVLNRLPVEQAAHWVETFVRTSTTSGDIEIAIQLAIETSGALVPALTRNLAALTDEQRETLLHRCAEYWIHAPPHVATLALATACHELRALVDESPRHAGPAMERIASLFYAVATWSRSDSTATPAAQQARSRVAATECLRLLDDNPPSTPQGRLLLARVLRHLGADAVNAGEPRAAADYLTRSLSILVSLKPSREVQVELARTHHNLAALARGDADEHWRAAIRLRRQLAQEGTEAALYELAFSLLLRANHKAAVGDYFEAADEAICIGGAVASRNPSWFSDRYATFLARHLTYCYSVGETTRAGAAAERLVDLAIYDVWARGNFELGIHSACTSYWADESEDKLRTFRQRSNELISVAFSGRLPEDLKHFWASVIWLHWAIIEFESGNVTQCLELLVDANASATTLPELPDPRRQLPNRDAVLAQIQLAIATASGAESQKTPSSPTRRRPAVSQELTDDAFGGARAFIAALGNAHFMAIFALFCRQAGLDMLITLTAEGVMTLGRTSAAHRAYQGRAYFNADAFRRRLVDVAREGLVFNSRLAYGGQILLVWDDIHEFSFPTAEASLATWFALALPARTRLYCRRHDLGGSGLPRMLLERDPSRPLLLDLSPTSEGHDTARVVEKGLESVLSFWSSPRSCLIPWAAVAQVSVLRHEDTTSGILPRIDS